MKNSIPEIVDSALTLLTGLVPGALGAAVGLAFETGITWSQRFLQLAVGIVVSWFVSRATGAVWAFDPFVVDGIGFTFGMIAFKATPRFITNAADVVAGAPALVRDVLVKSGSGLVAVLIEIGKALAAMWRDRGQSKKEESE